MTIVKNASVYIPVMIGREIMFYLCPLVHSGWGERVLLTGTGHVGHHLILIDTVFKFA